MNKEDLVSRVSQSSPNVLKSDVQNIVAEVFAAISDSLESGESVTITGFGTFSVAHRASRRARQMVPPYGVIVIPERDVPVFKPGKALKVRVSHG